ncbi:DUF742 domain-containing protein [Spirillospora sp. NPDC050679]
MSEAPPLEGEEPDRLYIVTGGRGAAAPVELDLVTLILAEGEPAGGMQSEHAEILRSCRYHPMAVVELSARLRMPVSVVRVLLRDLLALGRVTARPPASAPARAQLPDLETLKQVLVGLQNL